jgi:hypothetical protein
MFDFLKNSVPNEETVVRIMIYEIREINPDAVRFTVKSDDVRSILLYMRTRKYDTIMYAYGYKFLLEIMKMFEKHENYEECKEIKRQIEEHNKLLFDSIPTNI